MKKNTHNRITQVLRLLKRNKAYFFKDKTDGRLYYTYPRGGWVHEPMIDGKPLEWVSDHDDGGDPLNKIITSPPMDTPFRIPRSGMPILGTVGEL
jgi:hypothetical protein